MQKFSADSPWERVAGRFFLFNSCFLFKSLMACHEEAVSEPVGPRPKAPVPPTGRIQREQSMQFFGPFLHANN